MMELSIGIDGPQQFNDIRIVGSVMSEVIARILNPYDSNTEFKISIVICDRNYARFNRTVYYKYAKENKYPITVATSWRDMPEMVDCFVLFGDNSCKLINELSDLATKSDIVVFRYNYRNDIFTKIEPLLSPLFDVQEYLGISDTQNENNS